jgi:hypothetical protein
LGGITPSKTRNGQPQYGPAYNGSETSAEVLLFTLGTFAALALTVVAGLTCHRLSPKAGDALVVVVAAGVIAFAIKCSPWHSIRSLPAVREIELANPGADLSTPSAMLKSLASGALVFTVARIADATGFGVFMASATALGALGVSFTGISGSMAVLGFLLTPQVYVTAAAVTAVGILLSKIKSGDRLLGEAIAAAERGQWERAYSNACMASKKWGLLRASCPRVEQWHAVLPKLERARANRIRHLTTRLECAMHRPYALQAQGYLAGVVIGLIPGFALMTMTGSAFPIFIMSVAIGILCAERFQSTTLIRIMTELPQLQSEVGILERLRLIAFE